MSIPRTLRDGSVQQFLIVLIDSAERAAIYDAMNEVLAIYQAGLDQIAASP